MVTELPVRTASNNIIMENENTKHEDNGTSKDIEFDPETRHPLLHSWTLWYDAPLGNKRPENWGKNIKEVYTISTVCISFIYNHNV
jgi:hypothetical protein